MTHNQDIWTRRGEPTILEVSFYEPPEWADVPVGLTFVNRGPDETLDTVLIRDRSFIYPTLDKPPNDGRSNSRSYYTRTTEQEREHIRGILG